MSAELAQYPAIFDRHEHLRWNLNRDIPWNAVRPELVRDEDRFAIRTAALSEFTTLAASHNFLREFVDDVDFSCWVSVWFYEEVKHHYALRRWLERIGIALRGDEIAPRGRPYPVGADPAATCTMNVISELRAARWYSDLSHLTHEPVLAAILRNLAADEARHAVAFASFGKRYLERDRSAHLRPVLEMAYFWLADTTHFKHPADFFYPDAAVEYRIDKVPTALAALERANHKIFEYLTEMTDIPLHGCRDLKRALRPLVPAPEAQA
jgi:hypothetical protein